MRKIEEMIEIEYSTRACDYLPRQDPAWEKPAVPCWQARGGGTVLYAGIALAERQGRVQILRHTTRLQDPPQEVGILPYEDMDDLCVRYLRQRGILQPVELDPSFTEQIAIARAEDEEDACLSAHCLVFVDPDDDPILVQADMPITRGQWESYVIQTRDRQIELETADWMDSCPSKPERDAMDENDLITQFGGLLRANFPFLRWVSYMEMATQECEEQALNNAFIAPPAYPQVTVGY